LAGGGSDREQVLRGLRGAFLGRGPRACRDPPPCTSDGLLVQRYLYHCFNQLRSVVDSWPSILTDCLAKSRTSDRLALLVARCSSEALWSSCAPRSGRYVFSRAAPRSVRSFCTWAVATP